VGEEVNDCIVSLYKQHDKKIDTTGGGTNKKQNKKQKNKKQWFVTILIVLHFYGFIEV